VDAPDEQSYEPLKGVCTLAGQLRMEQLDGGLCTQMYVLTQIHLRKAALPQQADEAIVA